MSTVKQFPNAAAVFVVFFTGISITAIGLAVSCTGVFQVRGGVGE